MAWRALTVALDPVIGVRGSCLRAGGVKNDDRYPYMILPIMCNDVLSRSPV